MLSAQTASPKMFSMLEKYTYIFLCQERGHGARRSTYFILSSSKFLRVNTSKLSAIDMRIIPNVPNLNLYALFTLLLWSSYAHKMLGNINMAFKLPV